MALFLFYLILIIIIINFIIDRVLEYLNFTHRSKQLPIELQGIYNEEEYQKQQNYEQDNYRFGELTSSFQFLLITAMLIFGGFAFVDGVSRMFAQNSIIISLVFFGLLFFASDLLETPFSIYDTFVIEARYGFNKTSPLTFVTDKLKSWLITIIVGGGLLALLIWFYLILGPWFWLYAWGLFGVVMLLFTLFYSSIIVPLFNKQTPLPDGELKESITLFAEKVGFKLNNIYVIDGSKRSTKANAYFTGLGAKKRIVLYDTLINDLSTNEIVAVLAHEIGHYKKKHTQKGIIISLLQTGVTLYLLSLFVNYPFVANSLGVYKPAFHIGLIAFGILYSPISLITGLFMNKLSRKHEYEADRFCAEHFEANYLIDSLKKLSVKNLSNLTPHPMYVFFHYSHPTLLQRVKSLQTYRSEPKE